MVKKISISFGVIALAFILVLVFKTLTFSRKQEKVEAVAPVEVSDEAVSHLQKAIQFQTISREYPSVPDSAVFLSFHRYLADAFPLVDSMLDRKAIGFSLLYTWKGSDDTAEPVVFMSHMDVVPVDEGTLSGWTAPPFSGDIKEGVIYGRGTMDDKSSLMAVLESVEMLLHNGFQPKRTIYLAFGHDEEVGGDQGAGAVAKYMESQGIKAEFVIDEGGFVTEDQIPGISKPVAIINVAEKGFVSYELTINTKGGHSSMPSPDNTIGSLARAITRLEENQFEYYSIPTLEEEMRILGAELPFMKKVAFANSWLFGGPILKTLNAHTTTAPTIIRGGVKDNVIPTTASVVVNFRIMPGETVQDVHDHILEVVADDRLTIKPVSVLCEPSAISDHHSDSYKVIAKTVSQLFPEAIVSPGLLFGGTDTKHYRAVSKNQYRFYPIRLSEDNKTCFHGINEHLSVDNYKEMIQFCYQLMQNLNQ